MTISRRDKEAPREFPAARLYLDDVEEIVRILLEAEKNRGTKLEILEEDAEMETNFYIGDTICDQTQDLIKIAKTTRDFELRVAKGGYSASFSVSRFGTGWRTSGLSFDETWSAFRKLETLVNGRKLRVRTLVHGLPFWAFSTLSGATSMLLVVGVALLGQHMLVRAAVSLAAGLILGIALYGGIFRHSIVILRYSWDHSAYREDIRTKVLMVSIASIISFLLGLLSLYLKKRFWP